MSFNDHEKSRIRHHLGFINVSSGATFLLGVPGAVETQFMVERAMELVIPAAEDIVRQHVAVLDRIEAQMIDDLELLAVEGVDEIKIRRDEQARLKDEYQYWRRALANDIGINPNPFDKRFMGMQSGLNMPVQH